MRFPSPRKSSISRPGRQAQKTGPSIRLAATLAGLLLVLAAIARLQQPETHRSLGRLMGMESPSAASGSLAESPRIVSADLFESVEDNAPFRNEEQPVWFACLSVVAELDTADLAAKSVGQIGYAALSSQPDSYRGRVVTVSGTVHRVESVAPAANDQGIQQLWRVTLQPTGGEVWPLTLYTLKEPPSAEPPYEAFAQGLFFKKLSYRWSNGMGSTPVVVAKQIRTDPVADTKTNAQQVAANDPVDQEPLVFERPNKGSLGRALLEDLSFDTAALDQVQDKKPFQTSDTGPFYELLDKLQQTPAPQLVRLARAGLEDYVEHRRPDGEATKRQRQEWRELSQALPNGAYSVVGLFGDGKRERGELIVVDTVVRRVVRIDASSDRTASALGIDHYYELEAFSEDSQNLPIIFVMRELPPGFPVGEAVRQPARLAGFFFKQWAYRTRKRSTSGDARQFAPLLIGRAPIPIRTAEPSPNLIGGMLGIAATVALALVGYALWRTARHDREYARTKLRRFRESPSEGELEQLGSLVQSNVADPMER